MLHAKYHWPTLLNHSHSNILHPDGKHMLHSFLLLIINANRWMLKWIYLYVHKANLLNSTYEWIRFSCRGVGQSKNFRIFHLILMFFHSNIFIFYTPIVRHKNREKNSIFGQKNRFYIKITTNLNTHVGTGIGT